MVTLPLVSLRPTCKAGTLFVRSTSSFVLFSCPCRSRISPKIQKELSHAEHFRFITVTASLTQTCYILTLPEYLINQSHKVAGQSVHPFSSPASPSTCTLAFYLILSSSRHPAFYRYVSSRYANGPRGHNDCSLNCCLSRHRPRTSLPRAPENHSQSAQGGRVRQGQC